MSGGTENPALTKRRRALAEDEPPELYAEVWLGRPGQWHWHIVRGCTTFGPWYARTEAKAKRLAQRELDRMASDRPHAVTRLLPSRG